MNRKLRAAGYLAAMLAGCLGTPALAEKADSTADRSGRVFATTESDPLFDSGFAAGPRTSSWTIGPFAEIDVGHRDASTTGTLFGPARENMTARVGFRGAAKVDSRVGAIYSRLSLSFEHELRADDPNVLSGYLGARRTGFYGDRATVDVMTADAVFAMPLSAATFGFLQYGAEVEPGGSTDHQVTLRLRFDF